MSAHRDLGVSRTWLFVPGDTPARFDRALNSDADQMIIDLEDAVLPQARAQARENIRSWCAQLPPEAGRRVLVRVNGVQSPDHEADIALMRDLPGTAGCVLPMFGDESSVAAAERMLDVPVVGIVETARGMLGVAQVEELPANVRRLGFGAGDFAADLGVEWRPDSPAVHHARCQLPWAARKHALPAPIDTAFPWLADVDGLRRETALARSVGYTAKFCIHPDQLPVVTATLRPSSEEIAWAHRVLAAWNAEGATGAFRIDDVLVDEAVVKRARDISRQASDAGEDSP